MPSGGKAAARLEAFLRARGLRRVPVKPVANYQQALAARVPRRRAAPVGRASVWRPLGPTSIPHGQTYGQGSGANPAVAGRVAAIAVDPAASAHLLIGSAGGGVWESKNSGRTWEPRTDDQPCLSIGALAFDPSDPKKVYAGTGEGNALDVPGQGLLRSTDGGATWKLMAQAAFAGSYFYRLVVDPSNGKRLWAATFTGTFRSTDGGSSWSRIRSAGTWDLSLGSTELLAASKDGLYRSVDGGTVWTRVTLPGGPASFPGDVPAGRMAVAHARNDPGVAYVFAALDQSYWLWRRATQNGAFSEVPLPSLNPPGDRDQGYGVSQSWYDWFVGIDPRDANTVFLGAIDAFRGRLSANGQWTWTDISSKAQGDSCHPDQHTIAFDPSDPKTLYVGNDGGVFGSADGGDSWKSLNKGLVITEFEYLAQHPVERTWIIGGTQDNGTLRNRGAGVWDQIALGDGGDCAAETAMPRTCYHSYYGMAIDRSRSGGDSWDDISPSVPDTYNALFYPPLEASGKNLAKAGESVFVSDDEGTSWTEKPLPAGKVATAMAFASDTRLLVGREDGKIFRLDRSSAGWSGAHQLGRPRAAYVSDIVVQSGPPERYWASVSQLRGGHVYVSTDGGSSWTDATGNLPDVPVNALAADPKAADTLWAATDIGVFQTTNRGRSWSLFGTGLPRALAVDLVFHAKLRLLRVGTRSRGVWEIAVPTAR